MKDASGSWVSGPTIRFIASGGINAGNIKVGGSWLGSLLRIESCEAQVRLLGPVRKYL
jgi:hypothetical protein